MKQLPSTKGPILLDRVATILDQARGRVLRTVNQQMVLAYGLIGREIVLEVQQGAKKAGYREQVLEDLSKKLTERYGKGYSIQNLRRFRQFYLVYQVRLSQTPLIRSDCRSELEEFESNVVFSPKLGWSHYRALMCIRNPSARDYYEKEAEFNGWNAEDLERQIHTQTYERLNTRSVHQQIQTEPYPIPAHDVFKSTNILEFLNIPESPILHESQLEQAIITNLQAFMLELGKGFAFVARQRQLRFDEQLYYVDLVFYNYLLKCFVLVDLKIGEITHQDVGQMDGYVRLFEDQYKVQGDNPTIGLILCSAPNHAVAKYSVLNEAKQIFASQYLLHLPTEQELTALLERGRHQWEARARQTSRHLLSREDMPIQSSL